MQNYRDADIVYISNLCFSDEVNANLANKLHESLKPNTIIFASRPLHHKSFDLQKEIPVEQSWINGSNTHMYKFIKPSQMKESKTKSKKANAKSKKASAKSKKAKTKSKKANAKSKSTNIVSPTTVV
jgi:hypothetical protein